MAKKLDAEVYSVKQILDDYSRQYNIPIYQRKYDWSKIEVDQLLRDLEKFLSVFEANETRTYFMGSILVKLRKKTFARSIFDVVDGQQRITTFILLLKAFAHEFISSYSKENKKISEIIKDDVNRMIKLPSDQEELKLSNPDAQKALNNIIFRNVFRADNDETINYYANVNIFKKYFKEYFKNKSAEEAYKYWEMLDKVVFVIMTLAEDDQPLEMFENINSKGKELLASDLVKNLLFIYSSSVENEKEKISLENKILDLFNEIIYPMNEKDVKTFLKQYVGMKKGATVSNSNIYPEFKKMIIEKGYISETVYSQEYKKINELLLSLGKAAKIYKSILDFNKTDKEWMTILENFNKHGSYYPFIHHAVATHQWSDEYKNVDFKIIKSEFEEVMKILHSYKIRRLITKESDKDLINYSTRISGKLKKEGKVFTKEWFLNELNNQTDFDSKWSSMPSDAKFEEAFINFDFYVKNKDFTKEILVSLENYSNNEKILSKIQRDRTQIEHILPQKFVNAKGWSGELMPESEDSPIINKIGNLTLTLDNSKLGRKSFIDKRDELLINSKIRLNSYFLNIKEWNTKEITERSKAIAALAVKIWPSK